MGGHSIFSSPPQRPITSNFEGFSIPDFIHYIYFPILILEKEFHFCSVLNKGTTGAIFITSLVWRDHCHKSSSLFGVRMCKVLNKSNISQLPFKGIRFKNIFLKVHNAYMYTILLELFDYGLKAIFFLNKLDWMFAKKGKQLMFD